jgi:hypothetical protein
MKNHPFLKFSFYWTDRIYMTSCMHYLSTTKRNDEYMTFSERFLKRYPCYTLDHLMRCKPKAETKTVDFSLLWKILSSDNEELLEENNWIYEDLNDAKFLNIIYPESG